MIYTIYATWQVQGKFQVEADTFEEAKEKTYDMPIKEARVQEYIDDTFNINVNATGDGNPQPKSKRALPNRRTRTIE